MKESFEDVAVAGKLVFEAELKELGDGGDEGDESGTGEADGLEEVELGLEGLVGVGEEELGKAGDELGDVGVGEVVGFEEGEDGVGLLGGFEVDLFGGGEGGGGREAAGVLEEMERERL